MTEASEPSPPRLDREMEGSRARAFLRELTAEPVRFVANAPVRMGILEADGEPVPYTVNDGDVKGCYLVSPTAHYVRYAEREVERYAQADTVADRCLRGVLLALLATAGGAARALGLDRVVHLNNWLFSTNPVPHLSATAVHSLTRAVIVRHPDHAIVFRGLTEGLDDGLLARLSACGYRTIAHRVVYVVPRSPPRRHNLVVDQKTLAKIPYERCEGTDCTVRDFARIARLYARVYLDKYTPLNAALTAEWFELAVRTGVMRLQAFREPRRREVDAFYTWYAKHGVFTLGFVGHDQTREARLYRSGMAAFAAEGAAAGVPLNMSSGVGRFKRLRGAEPHMEYEAVYDHHLPIARRIGWRLLAAAYNTIGARVLTRYE